MLLGSLHRQGTPFSASTHTICTIVGDPMWLYEARLQGTSSVLEVIVPPSKKLELGARALAACRRPKQRVSELFACLSTFFRLVLI